MGNEIFGIDVAGIVADSLGEGLFSVSITREVRGVRDPNNLTGGVQQLPPRTFAAVGFWEDFTGQPPPGVDLELNDRKLVLLGDTIEPGGLPLRNDMATVHEPIGDASLFVVQMLSRDPAAATYVFLCRDRRGPDGV